MCNLESESSLIPPTSQILIDTLVWIFSTHVLIRKKTNSPTLCRRTFPLPPSDPVSWAQGIRVLRRINQPCPEARKGKQMFSQPLAWEAGRWKGRQKREGESRRGRTPPHPQHPPAKSRSSVCLYLLAFLTRWRFSASCFNLWRRSPITAVGAEPGHIVQNWA